MHGFKDADVIADIGRRRETQSAYKSGTQI